MLELLCKRVKNVSRLLKDISVLLMSNGGRASEYILLSAEPSRAGQIEIFRARGINPFRVTLWSNGKK